MSNGPRPPTAFFFQAPAGVDRSRRTPPRRRLRIAFLVPEDRQTGTYFRYHNLAIALRQLGHQVTIYSQSSENRLRQTQEFRDGVPYILSPTCPGNRWILPPMNPITCIRRILTEIEAADVYHLFQPFPTAAISWLWMKKRRPGLFVYDWDDFWINDEFGLKNPKGFRARWAARWISRFERKLPAACDLATTVSHPLAELARKWSCPQCTVLHNGVWPQKPREKASARAELRLQREAFYVGLMGWTGEVEWCFEAIRRFAPKFPNLRLAITGLDPAAKLAAYEDILPRVDYLGALPAEKFAYFNNCLDLGLVPMSATEFNRYRLPYKLTDHLAGGVPVLCSRIGEAARLAEELPGIHSCQPTLEGWLEGFHQCVTKIQADEAEATPSTEALFKNFSWGRIAKKVSDTYCDALVPPLGPPHLVHP